MSFDAEDILGELAESTGKAREWFDKEGYGFRRLGKLKDADIDGLASLLRYKRWAKANRERQRAISRAAYHRDPARAKRLGRTKRKRLKANPKAHAKRLESWRAYRQRRRLFPEAREKLNAQRMALHRRGAPTHAQQGERTACGSRIHPDTKLATPPTCKRCLRVLATDARARGINP